MGDVLGVSFKTAAFMIDRIRYAAAHGTLNDLVNASLVPEDVSNEERVCGDDDDDENAEAWFSNRAGEQAIPKKKADEAQFERFLSAARRFRQDNLADRFALAFGRIVKARLKLRAWREELERARCAD
jgi:hypothetical protein